MIALGCDHGGINIKNAIIKDFEQRGIPYRDFGCYTSESVDYPIYAYKVAKAVATDNEMELGIICCGTGIGVSMVANKVEGIRAAAVSEAFSAEMTRRHNNANILCLGGRVVSEEKAVELAKLFITTPYEGGRHERRVAMITEIENGTFEG